VVERGSGFAVVRGGARQAEYMPPPGQR